MVGAARRLLLQARASVTYPSGQTETDVPLDRLAPCDRKPTPAEATAAASAATATAADAAWLVPGARAQLRKVAADGSEKRVAVLVVRVVRKPSVKSFVAAIGHLVRHPRAVGCSWTAALRSPFLLCSATCTRVPANFPRATTPVGLFLCCSCQIHFLRLLLKSNTGHIFLYSNI